MRRLVAAIVLACGVAGEAQGYPIARERELGERFYLEATAALPMIRDPAVLEFVTGLGQRIVARLDAPQPFDYRFSIVRDAQLNAFAVPGGFIYLNSGLILRAANDAELAGVVGHEIAHSHAHHIVRQQEKTALVNYAALAGMLLSVIQPAIGAAAMGAAGATQLKYQREFEQEADYLGARFMREAGFDPHGMTSFMKRIGEEQRTLPLELIPPYLLSHPLSDERITHLQAATKDIAPTPGWDRPSFAFQRVQAILAGLMEDRSSARARYESAAQAGGRERALFGIVLLHQGDVAAARATLEQARSEGVADLEGDVGLALLRQGETDAAIRTLKARIEAVPGDVTARAHLGAALLQKEDFAAAASELEKVVSALPDLDQAEYDLGQSYGRSGDVGRGMFHLARAFELRGDAERALSHYERAVTALPAGSAEAEEAKRKVEILQEVVTRRVIGRTRER